MYRIMIIEDDRVIADTLESHLQQWGYSIWKTEEFHNIMADVTAFDPQLILLDISLPFYNGFHWCTEIRKRSNVPVVFISSSDDNMSIVMAMHMGGDDFIEKPFDLSVLTAKIQALLRRTYSFQGQIQVLEYKGILLNLGDATLSYKEQHVELTKNEFQIMREFLKHPEQVITREEIMIRLWESDNFIDDNTLTVNVTRLRRKLETVGLGTVIHTKKGIGYYIE